MKAEIDKNGVLHVIPENETEAFALSVWAGRSQVVVQFSDPGMITMRGEEHWRDTSLKVGTNWPPRLGDRS